MIAVVVEVTAVEAVVLGLFYINSVDLGEGPDLKENK